jgi:hypothetical protein
MNYHYFMKCGKFLDVDVGLYLLKKLPEGLHHPFKYLQSMPDSSKFSFSSKSSYHNSVGQCIFVLFHMCHMPTSLFVDIILIFYEEGFCYFSPINACNLAFSKQVFPPHVCKNITFSTHVLHTPPVLFFLLQ